MDFEPDDTEQKKQPMYWIFFWTVFLVGFSLVIALFMSFEIFSFFAPVANREAARHSTSKNNLLQIGIALHNYHEQHHYFFPPGKTTTSDGKPGHSWQTLMLPYLDQGQLFHQINLDQPWNAKENQAVFHTVMPVYLNPVIDVLNPEQNYSKSPEGYGLSHYVGNELVLRKNQGMQIREIRDGMSLTIFAMEIGENFKPWGDPSSLVNPVEVIGPGKKTSQEGGNYILMGDGAVRFVSKDVDPKVLQALSTPDQGEEVREFLKQSSRGD
ncbi:DUF1559 domain-containing protein [Gimesia maris]|mgnify:CR=1 FL=1|uniref:DUF1559 family PulG-like putative transporter n=1 Tax=Gimesia maris TaxID=122 RepID=UPI00241E945E|nr:DUF1559 domain-containing protein [Gimesia maris]|tara:strand:- start:22361 stop:23167 length:807 start_codon:yes stop_codon:yes gene_type:complete